MRPKEFLAAMDVARHLKVNTRHCWTQNDRKESVADHAWRLSLMVMLLENEPEFEGVDMNKVMHMCLIHDLGEAFTGDIPSFEKSKAAELNEDEIYHNWVASFPEVDRKTWQPLLDEMTALETKEAKLYKALDKLEALISHNESDIATWLPLEYELQKTYGQENMNVSPYMVELRRLIDAWTDEKINTSGQPVDR